VNGNGGIRDAAAVKPYFNHPIEMQPAFFARELTPGHGRASKDRHGRERFDWLHYGDEGVALQACLMAHVALIPNVQLPWYGGGVNRKWSPAPPESESDPRSEAKWIPDCVSDASFPPVDSEVEPRWTLAWCPVPSIRLK
jgi:hypothetical protein